VKIPPPDIRIPAPFEHSPTNLRASAVVVLQYAVSCEEPEGFAFTNHTVRQLADRTSIS